MSDIEMAILQAALAERNEKAAAELAKAHEALKIALQHIEHMGNWIFAHNAGYSFEALNEDLPGIRAVLPVISQEELHERRLDRRRLRRLGA